MIAKFLTWPPVRKAYFCCSTLGVSTWEVIVIHFPKCCTVILTYTATGFPKDRYHYYRVYYTPATTPAVHLFPHWNWPARATVPQLHHRHRLTNADGKHRTADLALREPTGWLCGALRQRCITGQAKPGYVRPCGVDQRPLGRGRHPCRCVQLCGHSSM
jgi:hypothetical protein